ncbi:MAG: sulfatase-like hydrolase/transferase [Lentisphaerae bacterium]|jgi:arylsulfatase A-like enzyme|nr:sulfatase-like hydrolase/transferase [Lentisphaerota bacterium]MBT4818680.1 sulfatase-like hydrolase/transferase [Lentisphaerota bacterium]MBT5611799.1 sulfatase-like hydrolase/transferase [Lentisphaerota bacterium]MBT7057338.1 sulfatase-like hydrolase/transferase [Lentisphaerota bacterium]MBT7845845.1 sulfatase-like hydrolase/transferase [Lentisphaerota bacterium]
MPEEISLSTDRRPNILWILSEDNSYRFMRLFHPTGAKTPHIERLADHGIVFTNTFSNAPVCSVARTTLITSTYAPRTAGQFHRKLKEGNLPPSLNMFPNYLGTAGYYRTNCAKKDYNLVESPDLWDESSNNATWRNRPSAETPFFHMHNLGVCHESCLHFPADEMNTTPAETDPAAVPVPSFHPDTPTFRYAYARYYDFMRVMDRQVGQVIRELEEDGLLEDTFIFYFGDNGGILPGSKGYLWEDGLRVPLVVRVPENFKHLAPFAPGERCNGFVSFVDFGATVLNLAGLTVPEEMDGQPFLGERTQKIEIAARGEAVGYADRFDEKCDLCRSLRKGRYKYIRNYQCFYPDGLHNNYRYLMAAYREWRDLHREGKLNELEGRFFERKPPEALFDLETDPDEVRNLADIHGAAYILADMRQRMQEWVKDLPDLSFYPENHLVDNALDDGIAFGERSRAEIGRLVEIADLALLPFAEAEPALASALESNNRWERYWGAIVCSCFAEGAESLADKVTVLLDDADNMVRVRAAEFLAIIKATDPRPTLYDVLKTTESAAEALLTLNTVVFVNDHLEGYPIDPEAFALRADDPQLERRMEYLRLSLSPPLSPRR